MNILLIDNYDSFTHNLLHALNEITQAQDELRIVKNDKLTESCSAWADKIIVSPGPGLPEESGQLMQFLEAAIPEKSTLGICLGHQAIGLIFGAVLKNMEQVFHGAQSRILIHDHSFLFAGLPPEIQAGRYHSWCIDSESVPNSLHVTASDTTGMVMGISHSRYDVHGVQFHPESFLTRYGTAILKNFCRRTCS